ncbi:hypothetical protein [Chitinophaga japonensis]|uniref:Uncharacterized protein n=1 Tax=Chitinophaga japonensis TaxID=104662 RepID=A0A562T4S6_CHIJA|nr:hypothetical protein [Chitinophaga japonensis]TWI88551.1 hypothetical protein LX66_2636 [Chitinophaga japonensis]
MKILVEVKESKAGFLLELLKSLPFVRKAQQVKPRAADGLREGLKEVKLHREGKLKLKNAREVFEDLARQQEHED